MTFHTKVAILKEIVKLENMEKTAEHELQEYKKAIEKKDGVNIVIENEKGEILIQQANYAEKKLQLPGGKVERGELSKHACVSETQEETGLIVEESDLKFCGFLLQRVLVKGYGTIPGLVTLYHTKKYMGEIVKTPTEEILNINFLTVEEILKRKEEFGLGYIRMIIHFLRVQDNLVVSPFEVRLADPVDWIIGGKLVAI